MFLTLDWMPFILFAIVQSATPGPNVILLVSSGSRWGYCNSFPHIIGVSLGFPFMFFIAHMGISKIFESVPLLMGVLKPILFMYIIWLAINLIREGFNNYNETEQALHPMSFKQAVCFQWINAKAWAMIFMSSTLFNFKDTYKLTYGAILFFIILFLVASLWVCIGRSISNLLQNSIFSKCYYILLAAALIATSYPYY